jgi:hypothetical protein
VLGVAESLSLAGFDVVIASGAGDSPQDAGKLVGQGERIAWCHLPEVSPSTGRGLCAGSAMP